MKLLNKLKRFLKKPKNVLLALLSIIVVLVMVSVLTKVHEGMSNSCDDTEMKIKIKLNAESGGSNRKINSATLYNDSTELGTATIEKDVDTGSFDSGWVKVEASDDCVKKPVTKVKFDSTGSDFKVSNLKVELKMGNKGVKYNKKKEEDFPSEVDMPKPKK